MNREDRWALNWRRFMKAKSRSPEEIDRDCQLKYGNLPVFDETEFPFRGESPRPLR